MHFVRGILGLWVWSSTALKCCHPPRSTHCSETAYSELWTSSIEISTASQFLCRFLTNLDQINCTINCATLHFLIAYCERIKFHSNVTKYTFTQVFWWKSMKTNTFLIFYAWRHWNVADEISQWVLHSKSRQCNVMFLGNNFTMCNVLNENIVFLRSEGHILLISVKFL